MSQLGDSGGARVCRVTERRLLAEKLREVDPERTRNCLLARELNDAEAAPPAALVERHLPTAQEHWRGGAMGLE